MADQETDIDHEVNEEPKHLDVPKVPRGKRTSAWTKPTLSAISHSTVHCDASDTNAIIDESTKGKIVIHTENERNTLSNHEDLRKQTKKEQKTPPIVETKVPVKSSTPNLTENKLWKSAKRFIRVTSALKLQKEHKSRDANAGDADKNTDGIQQRKRSGSVRVGEQKIHSDMHHTFSVQNMKAKLSTSQFGLVETQGNGTDNQYAVENFDNDSDDMSANENVSARDDSAESPRFSKRSRRFSLMSMSRRSSRHLKESEEQPYMPPTELPSSFVSNMFLSPSMRTSRQQRALFDRLKLDVADMFSPPKEPKWPKILNGVAALFISLHIIVITLETCDGQNRGSTDPVYAFLPTESVYMVFTSFVSVAFTLELGFRLVMAKRVKEELSHMVIWLDFLSLVPWYLSLILRAANVDFNLYSFEGVDHYFSMLRLLRAFRLTYLLKNVEQFQVLYLAVKASLLPLALTLFFLFTFIMILATVLFLAEPCFNVNTCAFTDVFNTAYFMMVTVATVGYGSQVPSLENLVAMLVTMVAMLLGQMYFSVPIAVIGTNFQTIHERFQLTKSNRGQARDAAQTQFDTQNIHENTARLQEVYFHLVNGWRAITVLVQNIENASEEGGKVEESQKESPTKLGALSINEWKKSTKTLQAANRSVDAGLEMHEKRKSAIDHILQVHAEARLLVARFVPHKAPARTSFNTDNALEGPVRGTMMHKARLAIITNNAGGAHRRQTRMGSGTWEHDLSIRGQLWLALEIPDSSRHARIINRVMVTFALASVFLFCLESLPELIYTGMDSDLCRTVVKNYCEDTGYYNVSSNGFHQDPGCFAYGGIYNDTVDYSRPLDFTCRSSGDGPDCYGYGLNFGSKNITAEQCEGMFREEGASIICFRQQCTESYTILDMDPYWIYFEWLFGITFTIEVGLRFFLCRDKIHFFRDVYNVFDVLSVIPFFTEVLEYMIVGVQPSYAIISNSYSLLSLIRAMKTTRMLKLTRHFRVTQVLYETAQRVYRPLTIPLFFLMVGCVIAGATFYELERGIDCQVGKPCMWWGFDLMTPEISAGLPTGKRVLIQNWKLSDIKDMKTSSWLSYTTLTSVGYGDLVPRTSLGRVFSVIVAIVATIYSAMPLSLVGANFYTLYDKHMEKIVINRGGSSASWHSQRQFNTPIADEDPRKGPLRALAAKKSLRRMTLSDNYALSEKELAIIQQFMALRKTMENMKRNLDNYWAVRMDMLKRINSDASMPVGRTTDTIEQAIQTKAKAIMDALMEFSQVIERLNDAPLEYEAFLSQPKGDGLNPRTSSLTKALGTRPDKKSSLE